MTTTTERPAVGSGRGRSLGPLLPAAGVGVLAVATFALLRTALVDDAYITLAYAKNVALHGTWGLLSDVTSNTATSPLWVLLLSAVTVVVRRPVLALGILHVAMAVALTFSLTSLARRTGLPRWTGPVGAVALGVNPLLLASVGLESAFLVLLLTVLLLLGIARRPFLYGLVAGAVVLARMDAGVVVVVLSLLLPGVLRRLHLAVAAALVVVVPWLVWSWFFLGSAVPDTVVIKTLQAPWGVYSMWNGPLLYLGVYSVDALVAFLPVVFGGLGWLVLLGFWRTTPSLRPWLAFGVATVSHYLALSVLAVPPYHWYYAVLVAGTTLVAVAALGAVWQFRPVGVGAGLAAGFLLVAGVVVDLRQGIPWVLAPVQSNFAEPRQYDEIARDVAGILAAEGGPQRIESPGEIGHLAYVCDCVVDQFADPARLQPSIEQVEAEASPTVRRLLELNFTHRDTGAAPVVVDQRLFRYDRGTGPAGYPTWPIDSTWDLPVSDLVLIPVEGP